MAEAMSGEQLAEIRATADRDRWSTYCGHAGPRAMVTDLLAEVERLQTQAAYMREQIEELAQVGEERNVQTVAYRALAEQHQKRGDKLSAQLAEIGETREEWSLVWPDGDRDDYGTGEIPARVAQEGTRARLDHRLAGKWREVGQEDGRG